MRNHILLIIHHNSIFLSSPLKMLQLVNKQYNSHTHWGVPTNKLKKKCLFDNKT